jgi:hypothetical protein
VIAQELRQSLKFPHFAGRKFPSPDWVVVDVVQLPASPLQSAGEAEASNAGVQLAEE